MTIARNFDRSPNFFGERYAAERFNKLTDQLDHSFHVYADVARKRDEFIALINDVRYRHVGVMRGEYLVFEHGLILVSRDGECLKINTAEGTGASRALDALCLTPEFEARVRTSLERWDDIPLITGVPILSDPHTPNYLHFTLQTVPLLRHFENLGFDAILIPQLCLQRAFQTDLLAKVLGDQRVVVLSQPVRVRDPLLAYAHINTDEGIHWLRAKAAIPTRPGSRRLYIPRRSLTRSTAGFGISDAPAFRRFLSESGFETIDFGSGEKSIEEQVDMLDGAGVILSPQGSTLVNLLHLNAPLHLIEIHFGGDFDLTFPRIALTLSFDYHGVISHTLDSESNIVVDPMILQSIMDKIGA